MATSSSSDELKPVEANTSLAQRFSASLRERWADYGFLVAFVILIIIAASASDVFFTQRNSPTCFGRSSPTASSAWGC
ncbi:MAG: hypothetical protein U0703_20330 [Anaerolineae bacterium]